MIGGSGVAGAPLDALDRIVQQFAGLGSSEKDLITRIGLLEDLKAFCAAGQVRATAALRTRQRERFEQLGVPEDDQLRGIAQQVGLARRESPNTARRHVQVACELVADMPHTLTALETGVISEWCAGEVVGETVLLTSEQRRELDAEVGGTLGGVSVRRAKLRARAVAQRLDPDTASIACDAAASKRCVTIRPADHGMTWLTALLPMTAGVAAYGALHHAAATAKAAGDPRGRGQLMADLLTHRLTNPAAATADAADTAVDLPAGVGVEIQLVMTDRTLLDGDDEPVLLNGHPLPAPIARRLLAGAGRKVRMWVRRLFTAPTSGELISCDQNRRLISETVRGLLLTRDQVCRTPWCGAPIRHGDHIVPVVDGGLTSIDNVQGLCENCNYAKQLPGWTTSRLPDGTIHTTTPTGHSYDSRPPPPPRSDPWAAELVRVLPERETG